MLCDILHPVLSIRVMGMKKRRGEKGRGRGEGREEEWRGREEGERERGGRRER